MKATGNIVRGTREREMRRQIRLVEERERERVIPRLLS